MVKFVCSNCEYEPLASDALRCPKCDQQNPTEWRLTPLGWSIFVVGFVALLVTIGISG